MMSGPFKKSGKASKSWYTSLNIKPDIAINKPTVISPLTNKISRRMTFAMELILVMLPPSNIIRRFLK